MFLAPLYNKKGYTSTGLSPIFFRFPTEEMLPLCLFMVCPPYHLSIVAAPKTSSCKFSSYCYLLQNQHSYDSSFPTTLSKTFHHLFYSCWLVIYISHLLPLFTHFFIHLFTKGFFVLSSCESLSTNSNQDCPIWLLL